MIYPSVDPVKCERALGQLKGFYPDRLFYGFRSISWRGTEMTVGCADRKVILSSQMVQCNHRNFVIFSPGLMDNGG
jgi:hypothetical protein